MTVFFRGASPGVTLAADIDGPWNGPAVALLHGGGQTRHAWKGTERVLAANGFLALTVDLRGHGESGWDLDGDYSIEAFAADVRLLATAIGRPLALVGASLGGLSALVALGEPPGLDSTALVLVDITPRMTSGGRERIGAFMASNPEGFASVDEAADAVSHYLPHRPRPADASGLAKNLRQRDDGRYYWHWDPRFMEGARPRLSSGPEQFELAAAAVGVPTLLVRGTESEIVSADDVAAFRAVAPGAEYVEVPKARHMVAGDQNDEFTSAVVEFLVRHVPR